MQHSESITKLAAALVAAHAEVSNPSLDGKNPHFNSKFTTLAHLRDHLRPILAKHGLAVVQLPCGEGGQVGIETIVLHSSGEWMSQDAYVAGITDPQKAGAALTYLCRYGLAPVMGVTGDEDDDGNRAMPDPAQAPRQQQVQQQSAPSGGNGVKEASKAQIGFMFGLAKEKGVPKEAIEAAIHGIKEKMGMVPSAWVRKQIERLQAVAEEPVGEEAIAAAFDATPVGDHDSNIYL